MTTTGRREPHRTTAADGSPIVEVSLAHGRGTAVIDAEDFDLLMEKGVSPSMFANYNGARSSYCVRACAPRADNLVSPARTIMDAGRGEVVRYRDHDPLNLRRDNLYLDSGRAFGREERFLAATVATDHSPIATIGA